jgi:ubiquinone/menaquinone biosynthesis C-methylase UbiE
LSEKPVEKKGFAEGFWSEAKIKEIFLEQQRKVMWNKDYWKNVLVPLFQLKQDSIVLDVGCGLGFLGQNLAEFVPDGKIIGVDLDARLIEAAKKLAENSEFGRVFDFRVGSAYELPVDSDSVDLAICQCVLMHLDDPVKAVSEMRRVARNGGRVVAMEPDNATLSFFDTAFEKMGYSLDERANFIKWEMMRKIGKKKLGKGDDDIGTKMPYLFLKNGLKVTGVRCFDRVFWLIPPYEQEGNDIELKQSLLPPEFYFENLDTHTEFMAGGGTEEEYKEYLSLMKREHAIRKQQIREKTFSSTIAQALILTIGEKI